MSDPTISAHARERGEACLRAATTVLGYALETEDGELGNVNALLIDDQT